MAFSGKFGEAFLELRAKQDKFGKDLDKARKLALKKTDSMAAAVGKKLAAFDARFAALAVAGGVAAMLALGKSALQTADNLANTADKIGLTTENLQRLRFAADQTGVAQTALDMGLQRFSRRIGEANRGTGVLSAVVREYGIELKNADGTTRDIVDVLGDYADVVAGASSAQEQLRLSFLAFDSEGAALVNLLREGRQGIQDFAAEADRLGITIEDALVRQGAAANDELNRMGTILKGNLDRLLLNLSPAVISLGEAFADAAPKIAAGITALLPASALGLDQVEKRLQFVKLKLEELKAAPSSHQFGILPGLTGGTNDEQAIDLLNEQIQLIRRKIELGNRAIADKFKAAAAAQAEVAARRAEIQDKLAGLAEEKAKIQAVTTARENTLEVDEAIKKVREESLAALGGKFGQLKPSDIVAGIDVEPGNEKLRALGDEYEEMTGKWKRSLESFQDQFSRSLADMLVEGEFTFGQLAKSFLKQMLEAQISTLFFGAGTPGGFAGIFSGKKAAHGGFIPGGRASIVGERGPELFVPNRGGTVIPNDALGGGGNVTVHQTVVIPAGVSAGMRQEILNARPLIEEWAKSAISDAMRRGGAFTANVRGF